MGILFGDDRIPQGQGRLSIVKPKAPSPAAGPSTLVRNIPRLTPSQARAFLESVGTQLKAKEYEHTREGTEIRFPNDYAVVGGINYILAEGSQTSGNIAVDITVNMGFRDMSRRGTLNDLTGIIDDCAAQYIPK